MRQARRRFTDPLVAYLVATGLLAPALPAPARADDADLPPFAEGMDKAAYLRARAEQIELMRGVPHFLPYDARARALEEMAEMEETERRRVPQSANLFWTQLGPAPIPNTQVLAGPQTAGSGRVSAIAVDPANPDIVYVGAAGGGVYRSINGGTSWTPIFDGSQTLAIGALALAPSNSSILYVGTGEPMLSANSFLGAGLYRIDDASTTAAVSGPFDPPVPTGVAGTHAFTGRAISEILVHPTDPATIFVSTVSAIGGNPSGGSIGFTVPPLGMLGLYRSNDATSAAPTFQKLTVATGITVPPDITGNISITDLAMDPGDPNRVVAWVYGAASAGYGGPYLSTNALAANPTFTQTLITTVPNARGELAGNRVSSTVTFYAATGEGPTGGGQLRKSTDGGATWSPFLTGAVNFCQAQCFFSIALDVHPTDANILNVGGSPQLIAARSTDGGATFTTNAQSAQGVHIDTHAIVIARSNPAVVYLGTDGGIYRSNDGGLTWVSLSNADFHATQFQSLAAHPTDRQFLIGGTIDNGTNFLRPDGTWFRADFGDGGYALIDRNAVDTTNVTMYHTYFNVNNAKGFARVTSAAGATEGNWIIFGCGFSGAIANGITCGAADATLFFAPMALGPGNPNTVYFGSDRLWRSTDSGATMPAVSQVLQASIPITTIAIGPNNDLARIVGLRNGKVFATTTGSNPLTDVTNAGMPLPHPQDANARRAVSRAVIHPTNSQIAYVAFGGYNVAAGQHVWKTTNLAGGAAFWTAAGAGIPDVPVNALAIDPTHPDALYAGTDIGVFVTRNGGASWQPFSAGLPRVPVFDLAFQGGPEPVLRAATHGRGIWEISTALLFADGFESGGTAEWSSTAP